MRVIYIERVDIAFVAHSFTQNYMSIIARLNELISSNKVAVFTASPNSTSIAKFLSVYHIPHHVEDVSCYPERPKLWPKNTLQNYQALTLSHAYLCMANALEEHPTYSSNILNRAKSLILPFNKIHIRFSLSPQVS